MGKHYKTLIDSGATISLFRYSTYKKIEDCYKTLIQSTTAKLNTADGSPMMALGSTALQLRIAEFKFTHNIIICDQLPETELILASTYKRSSHYLMLGTKRKIATYREMVKFLVYTHSCDHTATIGTVKLTLKIPPRHNGIVPIKISGPIIKTHIAYFLTDDSTPKGRDPNINIINGFTRSRERHLSTYSSLITPINTSHFIKENTLDTLNQLS